MNVAILSNFGPSYIYTFISPGGYLAQAHGPGMHFSYTRLGGYKQYGLRDSHFEISVGIYLGMLLYDFSNTELGGLYIYPKTNNAIGIKVLLQIPFLDFTWDLAQLALVLVLNNHFKNIGIPNLIKLILIFRFIYTISLIIS